MLGLLGNVAEVKALRPQLLTKQFITVFRYESHRHKHDLLCLLTDAHRRERSPCSDLLDSKADGIEVSYNACGVLSHIMFDGPEVWNMEEPRRSHVMDKMWAAIQSWDVSSRRNINYRCTNTSDTARLMSSDSDGSVGVNLVCLSLSQVVRAHSASSPSEWSSGQSALGHVGAV